MEFELFDRLACYSPHEDTDGAVTVVCSTRRMSSQRGPGNWFRDVVSLYDEMFGWTSALEGTRSRDLDELTPYWGVGDRNLRSFLDLMLQLSS